MRYKYAYWQLLLVIHSCSYNLAAMRSSGLKTTTAKLRKICEIDDCEMAKIMDRSVHTVHSIESGRIKLTKELAGRMALETGISPEWLLAGDTDATPIDINGKEYKREIFDLAQAGKIRYDRPIKFMRNFIAAGFCARLIAIMEGSTDFRICAYKVHKMLESLRHEFGQDQKLYPVADVRDTNLGLHSKAIPLLEELLAAVKQIDFTMRNYDALVAEAGQPTHQQSKQPSKKRRR